MGDIDRKEGTDQHESFKCDIEDGRSHAKQATHRSKHNGRRYTHHRAEDIRVYYAAQLSIPQSPRAVVVAYASLVLPYG